MKSHSNIDKCFANVIESLKVEKMRIETELFKKENELLDIDQKIALLNGDPIDAEGAD